MAKPVIFTVDDDPEVLRAVERDLRRRYGREYRILRADSGQSALETLDKLSSVYDILRDRRLERLGYTGDEKEHVQLSKDEIGDLNLSLLSEFVRVVMKRSYEPSFVEAMIQQAKEEVGVPGMSTGDLNAFEVA